jgi:large subunit ribosomal protein L25
VDFQRVDATTRMTVKVPLHFSGEENSPAVKAEKCLVNHVVNELTVTCFPADIPEFIAVDLSEMKKGSSLHINDITLPKGVKFVVKGQANPVLASVTVIEEEVEIAPVAAPAADAKGKGKKK